VHQVSILDQADATGRTESTCSISVVVFDTAPGLVAFTVPLTPNTDTAIGAEDVAAAVARVLAPAWWLHTRVFVPTSMFRAEDVLPPTWMEFKLQPCQVPLMITSGLHDQWSRSYEWWPSRLSQPRTWGHWQVTAEPADRYDNDRDARDVAAALGRPVPFFPPGTSMNEILLWANSGARPISGMGTPPPRNRAAVRTIRAAAQDDALRDQYGPIVRATALAVAEHLDRDDGNEDSVRAENTDSDDAECGWHWALMPDPRGAAHDLRCVLDGNNEPVKPEEESVMRQKFLIAADSVETPVLWAELADLLAEFDSTALWPGGAIAPLCVPPYGAGADWLEGWERAELPDGSSRRVLRLVESMKDSCDKWRVQTLRDDCGRNAVVGRRTSAWWVEWPVVAVPQVRARPTDTFIVGEHVRGGSALWLTRGTDRTATEAVPLVAGDSRFGLCPTPNRCCGPGLPLGAYRSLVALATGTVLSRDELDVLSSGSLLLKRLLTVPFRMHYGEACRLAVEDLAALKALGTVPGDC
jgi:hypothetical protein